MRRRNATSRQWRLQSQASEVLAARPRGCDIGSVQGRALPGTGDARVQPRDPKPEVIREARTRPVEAACSGMSYAGHAVRKVAACRTPKPTLCVPGSNPIAGSDYSGPCSPAAVLWWPKAGLSLSAT